MPNPDQSFCSDNCGPHRAEMWEATRRADSDAAGAYLESAKYQELREVFKSHFGANAEVYLVSTGTAADVIGIEGMMPSERTTGRVYCGSKSHLIQDEAGAVTKIVGCEIREMPTDPRTGKILVDKLEEAVSDGHGVADYHHSKNAVISITQPTECGAVYSLEEIRQITEFAHGHEMLVHMDGARLCYAAAALGVSLEEITRGVDVLAFGGKKMRMTQGEAIVVLNPKLNRTVDYPGLVKSGMQMDSDLHLIAAQFKALLENDFWRELAKHGNEMARKLWRALNDIGYRILQPETNQLFVNEPYNATYELCDAKPEPGGLIAELRRIYEFYIWEKGQLERPFSKVVDNDTFRLVTSPTVDERKVDELVAAVVEIRKKLGMTINPDLSEREEPKERSLRESFGGVAMAS